MIELFNMIDRKYPQARNSKWYNRNLYRIVRQYNDIKKLEARKPEVFRTALIALVDWVGQRYESDRLIRRKSAIAAKNAANEEGV